jgi:hypothetical protein
VNVVRALGVGAERLVDVFAMADEKFWEQGKREARTWQAWSRCFFRISNSSFRRLSTLLNLAWNSVDRNHRYDGRRG